MKHIVFIFIAFVFSNAILGQNTTYPDSSDTDCKIYRGKLQGRMLDSVTYKYVTSKHSSFIELTSSSWETVFTKYSLEKKSDNGILSIIKTVQVDKDSTPVCYVAIEPNLLDKIKAEKRSYKHFKKNRIFSEFSVSDFMIIGLFSKFITDHNLQTEYSNFKVESFVGWLKIKS